MMDDFCLSLMVGDVVEHRVACKSASVACVKLRLRERTVAHLIHRFIEAGRAVRAAGDYERDVKGGPSMECCLVNESHRGKAIWIVRIHCERIEHGLPGH